MVLYHFPFLKQIYLRPKQTTSLELKKRKKGKVLIYIVLANLDSHYRLTNVAQY